MPRFQFSVSTSEDIRQAGVVQSESFSDALAAITERIAAKDGDMLEVGVYGFPPARFECVWSKKGTIQSWRPLGLLAA